jgi:phosphotransferase system  glucose/maltose/N-acetylglucosamine-specific IIC component
MEAPRIVRGAQFYVVYEMLPAVQTACAQFHVWPPLNIGIFGYGN